MSSCTVYGCSNEKIYALINKDEKISRFSFSKSVLKHCGDTFLKGQDYEIVQLDLHLGRQLQPGEISRSGCYAIVAERGSKGKVLRVCYSAEMAEFIFYKNVRSIYELWVS